MTERHDPRGPEARAFEILRRKPGPDPEFEERLMRSVHATPIRTVAQPPRSGWRLAVAALVGASVVGVAWASMRSTSRPVAGVSGHDAVTDRAVVRRSRSVEFMYVGTSIDAVALLGDFNDWDPAATPLRRIGPRTWTGTVDLSPGLYAYSFLIDGERWEADQTGTGTVVDDFGRPSSMVLIAEDL